MLFDKDTQQGLDALVNIGGIGLALALGVGFFAWLGWRLDLWLNTTPWFLTILVLLGGAAGLYKVVRDVQRMGGTDDPTEPVESTGSAPPPSQS